MIAELIPDLRRFVPGLPRRIVALSTTTLSAGLAEAGVLVAVVRVAVGLADDSIGSVHVPFTDQTISDSDLLVAAAALAIANLLLHLVESRLKAALIADVYRGAREASILAFSRASWGRQSLEREGALQESVTSLTTQSANLMLTVVTLVTSTIHLAVLLLVAAFVDPIATVAVIAFGAVLFVALRPMARVTERNAGEWVKRNTSFAEEVTSLSSLAMELRVFGRHADARERLNELNDEVSETMRRMRVASGFGGTLYRDVALLLLVGAIGILLHLGDDAVLGFGIVALLILRSVASAQRVQSGLQSAREAAPAMRSLRQRISSLEDSAEPVRSARLEHLDTIRFDNATYRYPDDGPALTDFSLSIQKGEVLGVVGPSGSGKSTFAQLLLRLREPSSGRITIGDLDYTAITEEDWSRLVSLVPQEARLLEGSIADNIRFFRNGYSDAEVLATVRAAHLVDDLAKLPDGVRTALGPRGGGLSGGQRQRVTIARALLGRPELLVLDEPTSALDGRSEQLLNETIADLKATTTIVIIAHRLTTLKTCDRIAVFADGRLSQIGTRDELTNQPGFYQTVLAALAEG